MRGIHQTVSKYLCILSMIVLVLTGCQQKTEPPNIFINMQIETIDDSNHHLIVTVRDIDGNPITDATVKAELGELSVQSDRHQAGVFTIPVNWDLSGDWTITLYVTRPDNTNITREFEAWQIMESGACAPVEETLTNDEGECTIERPTLSPFALPSTGQ